MAFEVLQSQCGCIPRGRCSISSRGMARVNARDLVEVGITARATILIDRERGSIALRAPLECEDGQAVGSEGRKTKTVWLAGAMRALGLDAEGLRGWHGVVVCEDRLEFRFDGRDGGKPRDAKARRGS